MAHHGWRITIQAAEGPGYVPVASGHVQSLLALVERLDQKVPLSRLRFVVAPPGDNPARYLYRINAIDGRVWSQFITFASATDRDPAMTFNVDPGWRLSEFELQRDLRIAIIDCHVVYKTHTLDIELVP